MNAIHSSPPQLHDGTTVSGLMRPVLLALLPGLAVKVLFTGWQVLLTLLLVAITALTLEAVCVRLRGQAPHTALKEDSALLTALLLTLALPADTPWALALAGSAFAILIVKQAFGGLGQNVFNPAMGGVAFLLLAFPQAFGSGPASDSLARTIPFMQPGDTLFFTATAGQLLALAYLAGGLVLVARRVIDWLLPMAILVTAALILAAMAPDQTLANPESLPRFMALQLLNPAWVLAAFFLATDPVTAPVSVRARLAYGILIGGLLVLIRHGGHYVDGVAFAILLGNFFAPLLDQTLRPRVLGRTAADDLEAW